MPCEKIRSLEGLGDLSSGLPAAFDEALVGCQADFRAAWKHICDYVASAAPAALAGNVDDRMAL